MEKFAIKSAPTLYKNNGQQMEANIRFTITDKIARADNIPFYMGADCETAAERYQIKSARATVCKGATLADLDEHIKRDRATRYIYATKCGAAYVMSACEFREFADKFGRITRESDKNGGAIKRRLGYETPAMLAYLEKHTTACEKWGETRAIPAYID
jgi:hypothetical protein